MIYQEPFPLLETQRRRHATGALADARCYVVQWPEGCKESAVCARGDLLIATPSLNGWWQWLVITWLMAA